MGEGKTSRVYLGREINEPNRQVAIKVMKLEYLRKKDSNQRIEKEIIIMDGLKHPNINKLIGYGSDGTIVKPTGEVYGDQVFMVLEYKPQLFFDVCKATGAMGEDAGRFFMN